MATAHNTPWIFACSVEIDRFPDFHSLVFLFDPLADIPDHSQTNFGKVLCWAVLLNTYYTCAHKDGLANVWQDLLHSWGSSGTIYRLVSISVYPSSSSSDSCRPTLTDLVFIQSSSCSTLTDAVELVDILWCNAAGAAWVPSDDGERHLRHCIITSSNSGGHRGSSLRSRRFNQAFFGRPWQ